MAKIPTIPDAKLLRIEGDLHYIKRHPSDGPMLSCFRYDHGHTIVVDTNGKQDLLIEHSDRIRRDCARLLQHVSPAMIAEFVRGYRLARGAGLLE